MTSESDYPAYIDRYDAEIVSRLNEGEVYGVKRLQRAYRQYTDISRESTAKERKKALVNSPAFENVGIGKYRFIGCKESDLL